jgi:hypothetical protein
MTGLAVPAAFADDTPIVVPPITVTGSLIGSGVIVDPSGQPTVPGTDNSCGASVVTGCLVDGNYSASNSGTPIVVSDGFSLVQPVPSAWTGLEQSAESTVANLRGVPADRRNQFWARPEIDALMFLELMKLIHQGAADGEALSAEEHGALDLLRQSYQDFEEKVADRALSLYHSWEADPCSFRVPVGDDPSSYHKQIETLCASPIAGLVVTVPAPTAEEFTEWARELVEDDYRQSLVPEIQQFAQNSQTELSDADADLEVAREYQHMTASLDTGFSFLAAEGHNAVSAPAGEQPEATGELLDELKEAATEFGSDQFRDVAKDMLTTFSKPLFPYFFQAEATEAEEMFESGLFVGAVVLGATAVITTEAIQVFQDSQVLPTLNANRYQAYSITNLDELVKDHEGWQKLVNAFVNQLMPDLTFRKRDEPAPDGAPPGASPNDPEFRVRAAEGTTTIDSPTIAAQDWARGNAIQSISVANGWVTRAAEGDGKAWSDTSFDYIDWQGDWWRAWPVRGSLLQIRFGKQLGAVSVHRYISGGAPGDIACRNQVVAVLGGTTLGTNNGFRCVNEPGASFRSTLHSGDLVAIGDEVKKVDVVFDDESFTTTTPLGGASNAIEPIDAGSTLVKLVPSDANCWTDGNCAVGDAIKYRSRSNGLYEATIGDRPPVMAPSITGSLHSETVELGQRCDPQGDCTTPSVPTWSFAPGETLTLATNAYDPDPGESVGLINWWFCDEQDICDATASNYVQTFSWAPEHAGVWTVRILAYSDGGKWTEVDTHITVRKVNQILQNTLPSGGLTDAVYGDAPRTVSPTATSGLAVDVASQTPSVCTTSGSPGATITFIGAGECRIRESQTGNETYNAAPGVGLLIDVLPKDVTVNLAPPAVQYSDPIPNLDAIGSLSGLVGADSLSGTLAGCGTNVTTASGGITSAPGSYPLDSCGGLSNPNYSIHYSGALQVNQEDASLTSTVPELVGTPNATATRASVPLSASVAQAADGYPGDLTKATVDFLVWSSGNTTSTPSYTANGVSVAADGLASTTLDLPPDAYRVVVRFGESSYFTGPADMGTLVVFQPTPGIRLTGGGWIRDPSTGGNQKVHFSFNVSTAADGAPDGAAVFAWTGETDGYAYSASCSGWGGGGIQFSGSGATTSCRGSLAAVDRVTGLPVPGIGGTGYEILTKAADGGNGHKRDTFSIVVTSPSGAVAHSLVDSGGGQVAVGGGNINFTKK